MARPVIPIDEDKVAQLAERGWKVPEIAAFFRVHPDTIRDRFSELIRVSRANGDGIIRDMMWNAALTKGDVKAINHLAKHRLGEHDQQHIKLEKVDNEALVKIIESRLAQDQLEPGTTPPEPKEEEGDE